MRRRDQRFQVLRHLHDHRVRGQGDLLDLRQIDRGAASPRESLLVGIDRDAVELDGAQERCLAAAGSSPSGTQSPA